MQGISNHVSKLNKMYNELGTKKLRILIFKCDSLFKNSFTCRHVSKKELDEHYNQDNRNVKINKETEDLNTF